MIFNLISFPGVAGTPAFRTRDVHIREKLHVQADDAGTVADRAAQFPRIVRKIARFIAGLFCFRQLCKGLSQQVMDIGVGRHRGADIDTNGSGVNEFYLLHTFRFDASHILRQFFFSGHRFQSRNQTLQDQRGLSGTGDSRDHGQSALWNGHI